MKSWTLSFLKDSCARMSLASAFRLRSYYLRESSGDLRADGILPLRLKHPFKGDVYLRERGSDLATFQEIVVEEVYRPVLLSVKDAKTVIDLGSNIGLTTLYLAYHYPTCQVLCIEPNPDTYELLVRNVSKLNRMERCKTLNAAAWSSHVRLAPDQRGPADRYSTFAVRAASEGESSALEGYTMNEILDYSGFDWVDLLKVDIEGAERELFSSEDLSWLNRVGAIAIEFHEDSRISSGFDDKVKQNGFDILSGNQHTVLARKTSLGND